MLVALTLYCLAMVGLGAWAARKVRHPRDFFVAGRCLPAPLVFATFFAANLGAGSTVGAAEFGYRTGLSAWWWVGSAGIGSILLALVAGPRLHRLARGHGLYTVGDYLKLRYGRATRWTVASVLLVGSPAILAGQIIAASLVLQVALGVSRFWGAVLGGAVATAYFTMGGLRSSAQVNGLQVTVKLVAFLVAVPWALWASGGWLAVEAVAPSESWVSIVGGGRAWTADLVLMLAPAFIVSPGLVQRLFAARDEAAVRAGVGLQGLALLAFSFLPVVLGMLARVNLPDLDDPARALIALFGEVAPAWLGGMMLAAILSAELSSADAVLFMIATSMSKDVLAPLARRGENDPGLVRLARRSAVAAGALAVVLANWFGSVLSALSFFYSLLTVTLFVPLLAGLFWGRPGQPTALAGIGCSLVAAGLSAWLDPQGGVWLQPVPAGIMAGAAVFGVRALLPDGQGQSHRPRTRNL